MLDEGDYQAVLDRFDAAPPKALPLEFTRDFDRALRELRKGRAFFQQARATNKPEHWRRAESTLAASCQQLETQYDPVWERVAQARLHWAALQHATGQYQLATENLQYAGQLAKKHAESLLVRIYLEHARLEHSRGEYDSALLYCNAAQYECERSQFHYFKNRIVDLKQEIRTESQADGT